MERNNIEPKRDVPALVEALRIRALTLTGQSWERAGTIAMMKDAADMLEQLTADICEHLAASPRVGAPTRQVPIPNPSDYWKCFHCGEVFVTEESAARHFGPRDPSNPLHARNIERVGAEPPETQTKETK
jgi:hypothetical protein